MVFILVLFPIIITKQTAISPYESATKPVIVARSLSLRNGKQNEERLQHSQCMLRKYTEVVQPWSLQFVYIKTRPKLHRDPP